MIADSTWMLLSMIAFAAFLFSFAWSLLRPSRQPSTSAADIAAEQFAQGEIDADAFEGTLRDIHSGRR